jgi:hypothetical protein
MKTFFLIATFSAALLAQQGERSNRPQTAPQITPSSMMTTILPAQDITITISVSAELATAIEKRRRDNFEPSSTAGGVVLVPKQTTLAAQILFDMQAYFNQLLKQYPSVNVKIAQDAANAAIKAADKAASDAATPKLKP